MEIYVQSSSVKKGYHWVPLEPKRVAKYDYRYGETARVEKAGLSGHAAVLPDLPTDRTDIGNRVIMDKLVVEGITQEEALRLVACYNRDIRSIADMVEAHLQKAGNGRLQLTPGLEDEIAALLERSRLQDSPTSQAAAAYQSYLFVPPTETGVWMRLALALLRLILILTMLLLLH